MVEQEAEIETASVGKQLRECREKKQIGLTEIAAQMHLDARVIRAIEDDDYDLLPDPIYVRGYIRSYCKLLGLNADEFLVLFKQNASREDPEIIPEIKYPSQSSSSDKPVKVFTYLITLGLVLLVIAWWQSNFIIKNPPSIQTITPENTTTATPKTAEPLLEEMDELDISAYDAYETPAENPTGAYDDTLTMSLPTELENLDYSGINGAELTQDMGSATAEPEAIATLLESNVTERVQVEQPGSDDSDSEQSVSPPSVGPDTLVINISSDSWIEIFDINEQKIFFDLGRTGDRLTLNGTAPFDILLGFAQGVTIEFNGDPVDQAPYTRAGVARFSLGE